MSVPSTPVPDRPPSAARSRRGRLGTRDELSGGGAAAAAGLDDEGAVLLLVLALDDFRRYNAEHGYAAGDAVLDDVADRLAERGRGEVTPRAEAHALARDGPP